MIKRLLAIGFIFGCTTIAWFILAGVTAFRTNSADQTLRQHVERMWGAPHVQQQPAVAFITWTKKKTEVVEGGKTTVHYTDTQQMNGVPLESGNVRVNLALDHRQKGLLWYATYGVAFDAEYTFVNSGDSEREFEVRLPFPAKQAVFDDLRFEIDGSEWLAPPVAGGGNIRGRVKLAAGARALLRVGYRSQGLDRWTYQFGGDIAEVRNFKLAMRTNFTDIDFPEGSISPGGKTREGGGWQLVWEYRHLVSGVNIAMAMPEKLQPGPLASTIAEFAPLSLFFFIIVLLTIGVVKGTELHPMHYFFIAAAFFAFHLLFSYLVDLISIHAAFAVAAVTSLALVISYLRIVVGDRFAFFAAGSAQLVYLVLFSYAFFFKGMTGLAITIGAVITLFVLMQATAKVRWTEIFPDRPSAARVTA